MTIRRFTGAKLAAVMKRNEAYAVLDQTSAAGATWAAGGCWLLAAALHEMDLQSELWAVVDGRTGVPQHIVVEKDGFLWDSRGATTEKTLLRRARNEEDIREPKLVRFTGALKQQAVSAGIPMPTAREIQLVVAYLVKAL